MKTNSSVLKRGVAESCSVWLLWLGLSCKDEEPCDPGQEERSAGACFPIAMAGAPGNAGSPGAAGSPATSDGPDAGTPGGMSAEVGQPCTDTTGSSDCGGAAPICAPFPSGSVCTQILCQDGEPNAGVCPADAPCVTFPPNPSVCFPM